MTCYYMVLCQSYVEYFFDNYIEEISSIYEIKMPNKDEYLKNIYSSNYKSLPFFEYLYKNEKNSIDKFNKKGEEEEKFMGYNVSIDRAARIVLYEKING